MKGLTAPARNINPAKVSFQQKLVLSYWPIDNGKLSHIGNKEDQKKFKPRQSQKSIPDIYG